ncbi:MAG: FAD-dependent oxidoreductase [Rhodocyclaceae bacterium]|nr:FAD-dependent oxidoreductase [Rhodocyclaceae bacterium]
MNPIVVLGSGLAGISVVRELRKLDQERPVVIVTWEDGGFYSKPSISNAFAQSKSAAQLTITPRDALAAQLKAEIRAGARVTAIDPQRHEITIDGTALAYSRLVLAVGAQPIRLPIAGTGAGEILSVNWLSDYAVFRARLEGKRRVALLGAGLIGCEFANDLRGAGFEVDVFDIAPQPLGRLLPAQTAAYFRNKLEAAGVRFHFGASVSQVDKVGDGYRLTDNQGGATEADLVLSAVGLKPEISLAQAAGLSVNRGIVTDKQLATSAPDIYAVGDCAEVAGLNLPFVMPIMQQARALGRTLVGTAAEVAYPAMPVVVKTPACPAVVCPPALGAAGAWREEATTDGMRAIFESAAGQPLGFALVGDAVAGKQALAAVMPVML